MLEENTYADCYRQLAALIVLQAVQELKGELKPPNQVTMPPYEFLVSDWGLELAEAGAGILPEVMRAWAERQRANNEAVRDEAVRNLDKKWWV